MKSFSLKTFAIATALFAASAVANATPIYYGTLSGSVNNATVASTSNLQFGRSSVNNTTEHAFGVTTTAGTGGFSTFSTVGDSVIFAATAPNNTSPATFALSDPYSSPVLFLTITQGGNVMYLYLTDITSVTKASGNSSTGQIGSFLADGYVTLGADPTQSPVSFSFTEQSKGTGNKVSNYTITGITPEPSSLALLGTGLLGLAGVARRKLRVS